MPMTDIHIFKTNIESAEDLKTVARLMDSIGVSEWNVDTEDVDCVLRIVTNRLSEEQLLDFVTNAGFQCSELI